MAGLYSMPAWDTLRAMTFARDNWRCQWPGCGASVRPGKGHPRSAVCDHIEPHRGDVVRFMDPDNLQTLCKFHHDSAKQSEERRVAMGSAPPRVGLDGWPADPAHLANVPVTLKEVF